MALIKCPECGREISDCAPTCPHCGKPMQSYYVETPKKKRHGCLWTILVFAILAVILALTCPGKEEHKERMASELTSILLSEVNNNDDSGVGTLFTSAIAGPLVKGVIDQMLVVDSYGILSIGRFKNIDNGEDRIVSIGLLNYVYTSIDDGSVKSVIDDYIK